MEEDEGVMWENYSLFLFFFSALSRPIPEMYVVYATCLSDAHKEMFIKQARYL